MGQGDERNRIYPTNREGRKYKNLIEIIFISPLLQLILLFFLFLFFC